MAPFKLNTYEDWKHCITEICKVPLTADFVERRLEELRDPHEYTTQCFLDCWGEAQSLLQTGLDAGGNVTCTAG